MNAFFADLGRSVLGEWKRANFSLPDFPEIARAAMDARPPCDHVDLGEVIHDFLLDEDQPLQSASGFGQPELVVYDHPRFYIQLLFWLDGTTDIHQHEFSGAFHVLEGSSLHSRFAFEKARSITAHFRVGDLILKETRLLESGSTVPIVSGPGCIHALFHLDTPSVTAVVRTRSDPGTGPQFTYLQPHVALDPVQDDVLTMRRKQLLDTLERVADPDYVGLVVTMVEDLDLERGFFILQNGMSHLQNLGAWQDVWKVFAAKHGSITRKLARTLDEIIRRDVIVEMRGTVEEVDHRFFLALLLNIPDRASIVKLVSQRFPGDPTDTILRWAGELGDTSDDGTWILDAVFPKEIAVPPEERLPLFLKTLQSLLAPRKSGTTIDGLTARNLKAVRASLAKSSLRTLIADL